MYFLKICGIRLSAPTIRWIHTLPSNLPATQWIDFHQIWQPSKFVRPRLDDCFATFHPGGRLKWVSRLGEHLLADFCWDQDGSAMLGPASAYLSRVRKLSVRQIVSVNNANPVFTVSLGDTWVSRSLNEFKTLQQRLQAKFPENVTAWSSNCTTK